MCEYKFISPIHINPYIAIIEISGLALVKYNASGVPIGMRGQLTMKEKETSSQHVREMEFGVVKSEISTDNIFNCIFKEIPRPVTNDLDPYEYPRRLSISVTGSVDDPTLTGQLFWSDIGGRPMTVKIQIAVVNKRT